MQFSPSDVAFALSGLIVGLLIGQTGVGGGSLMTPILVLLFGIHPASAVGADLLYASATKAVGSTVHGLNRSVDWRLSGWLAAGSLPATAATLFVLSRFDVSSPGAARLLSAALGCVLVATALCLVFRRQVIAFAERVLGEVPRERQIQLTVLTGALLGFCVSVTSVGAGAIGVTAMLALYPRMPLRTVIGSDIVHAVPLTLLAGVGHFMMGSVDGHLVLVLLCGSLPGVLAGSLLVTLLPEFVTRSVLATVLAAVGLMLVI